MKKWEVESEEMFFFIVFYPPLSTLAVAEKPVIMHAAKESHQTMLNWKMENEEIVFPLLFVSSLPLCAICGRLEKPVTVHVAKESTVEPPIAYPLRSGQPLYSRQMLCYGLNTVIQ